MISKAYTIEFTGLYQGRDYYLRTYENEYRNLMVLLKDKICPDDFGQCGGVGRCGTCLVNISGLAPNADESYTNERNTLSKMGIKNPITRLSCQVQIDEDLKNVVVELFDNVY
jgi:ferredoxin, 2Fe-2S